MTYEEQIHAGDVNAVYERRVDSPRVKLTSAEHDELRLCYLIWARRRWSSIQNPVDREQGARRDHLLWAAALFCR